MKKYITPKTDIIKLNLNDSILEGAGIGSASYGASGPHAMSKENSFLNWEEEDTEENLFDVANRTGVKIEIHTVTKKPFCACSLV